MDDLHKVVGGLDGVKITSNGFSIKYQKYQGSPDDHMRDGTYDAKKDPQTQNFYKVMDELAKSPEFKGKTIYKQAYVTGGGWHVTLNTDPVLYAWAASSGDRGEIRVEFDTKSMF